nr:hypothetical protein [Candidatus Krumholzibacteria bacterium]
MKKSALYLLLFSLAVVPMVFLAGCDDDDNPTTTTVASKPFVSAFVGLGGPRKVAEDPSMAAVSITNFTTMPGVTMNGQELFPEPEFSFYGGGVGFMGDCTPDVNNQVSMEVSFGAGSDPGVGTITLPGENEVAGESDLYLELNEALEFAWTTAEGADKYVVQGYVDVQYVDQEDAIQRNYYRFSFFTTDTSATVAADLIWPAAEEFQTIQDVWGDIDVVAVSGPTDPGEPGNVTGSCNGILISYGRSLDWDLDYAE